LAAVLAIGLPFGTLAGTIIVPSGSIVTIQDGVDAASPGDTIQVLPGNYYENVFITTPRIKLQAETETGPVYVFARELQADFRIRADDVEIEVFTSKARVESRLLGRTESMYRGIRSHAFSKGSGFRLHLMCASTTTRSIPLLVPGLV